MKLKLYNFTAIMFAALSLTACTKTLITNSQEGKTRVVIYAGDTSSSPDDTKTFVQQSGASVAWHENDQIALWAKNTYGRYEISAGKFSLIAKTSGLAAFTGDLQTPMPEGAYSYVAAYPYPLSVSGTNLTFNLPTVQDGVAGGGADIMISSPVTYGALRTFKEYADGVGPRLSMHHAVHFVNVTLGDSTLEGEKIEHVELTFTRNVTGTVIVNFETGESILTAGSRTVTIPVIEGRTIMSVAVIPTEWGAGDSMSARLISESKFGQVEPISLAGRNFAAGHATPVTLRASSITEAARLDVVMKGSNLGEEVYRMTVQAPAGMQWGISGMNILEMNPGRDIVPGEKINVFFNSKAERDAFAGKTITVTYESESVLATQNVTLGSFGTSSTAVIELQAPYLLEENFDTVEAISSTDNYTGGSNAGSKDAYLFKGIPGWTGARVGAAAGKCVRIAGRREASPGIEARYPARIDSAPIIALKKVADIAVSYDYATDMQANTDKNKYPQEVFLGYTTSANAFKSGDSTGTFEAENKWLIPVSENGGGYDSTPRHMDAVLHDVPTGLVRICWRSRVESHNNMGNTTVWLYIDNVKVKIKK